MKEVVSRRQAVAVMTVFILGSSIIILPGSEAGQDAGLAQLLSAVMSLPVVMIYARLIRLFPGRSMAEMLTAVFGEIWGRVLLALMTWYALHLCALVINNFTGFIKTVAIPETPILPIMTLIMLVVIFMVKSGIEAMGKWTLVSLPISISVAVVTTLLSLRQMDFTNILPVFGHDLGILTSTAYKSLAFPYAETVIFLFAADSINKRDNPYRIYLYAVLLSTFVIVIIILRNIELMGAELIQAVYFPSYVAVRLISIGNLLQRIEGTLSMSFILVGIGKSSLCLLAAAKGTAVFFKLSDYRQIVLPVSLLALAVSAVAFNSITEAFNFIYYYQYYAVPFQFIIPLLLWLTAEYKKKGGGLEQKSCRKTAGE